MYKYSVYVCLYLHTCIYICIYVYIYIYVYYVHTYIYIYIYVIYIYIFLYMATRILISLYRYISHWGKGHRSESGRGHRGGNKRGHTWCGAERDSLSCDPSNCNASACDASTCDTLSYPLSSEFKYVTCVCVCMGGVWEREWEMFERESGRCLRERVDGGLSG